MMWKRNSFLAAVYLFKIFFLIKVNFNMWSSEAQRNRKRHDVLWCHVGGLRDYCIHFIQYINVTCGSQMQKWNKRVTKSCFSEKRWRNCKMSFFFLLFSYFSKMSQCEPGHTHCMCFCTFSYLQFNFASIYYYTILYCSWIHHSGATHHKDFG